MISPAFRRISKELVLLLMVVLSLRIDGVSAANALQTIKPEGNSQLSLTLPNGIAVRVTLSQVKVQDSYPYKGALLWGGDVDQFPHTILSSLQVQVGEQMLFVPLSAYGDLGDVMAASLQAASHGFTLSLHGGQTAAAYDAVLVFNRTFIVNRTVANREFPEQSREKTTYSFPK